MKRILLLGGYGNFGKRIASYLVRVPNTTLILAARNQHKCQELAQHLSTQAEANLETASIDIYHSEFEARLNQLAVDIVIHTSGPFQRQNYSVPSVCAKTGTHYIDLADDRDFVAEFENLTTQANRSGAYLVSGASSVPGISSAVVEHYQSRFSQIDAIDIAIAPANQAERGDATIRGILSATGQGFKGFQQGQWHQIHGWMSSQRKDFDGLGPRWLANVNVPDLALFPNKYKVTNRVTFQAGLELSLLHWGLVFLAKLVKSGLISDLSRFSKPIIGSADLFKHLGTANGGMQVVISGTSISGERTKVRWSLVAPDCIGPWLPILPTIVLVKKWITDSYLASPGAFSCCGLVSLQELTPYFDELGIQTEEHIVG